MKAAGYDVRETDPFEVAQRVFAIGGLRKRQSLAGFRLSGRRRGMPCLRVFLSRLGCPKPDGISGFCRWIYQSDAYHSLSIEGYRVSPELIERVMSGAWDPAHHEADRQSRDALAARGYWQAFQKVKGTVSKVLAGGIRERLPERITRNGTENCLSMCCLRPDPGFGPGWLSQ